MFRPFPHGSMDDAAAHSGSVLPSTVPVDADDHLAYEAPPMAPSRKSNTRNKFCKLRNLRNESDVEQNFLVRLLDDLGFTEDYRETKSSLHQESIDKGRRRRLYVPDYICYVDSAHKFPVLVVDAKQPSVSAMDGVLDAQLYASVLRRKLLDPKPVQFCIGSNGHNTIVLHHDSNTPVHDLAFDEFADENLRYQVFKTEMCRTSPTHRIRELASEPAPSDFHFKKPDVKVLRGIFEACHDVIWKREFESPVPAFWEFCKLMFIKLHEDRRLHDDAKLRPLLESGQPLPREKITFSVDYIDRVSSESNPNPIATIFETIRDNLESQVLAGTKKRIFNRDERLTLQPLTVRRVVGLLEHHDLIRIDEDLNGRLFQTFLSATMRGKQLGQFFTPRTVVELMCELADLRVTRQPPYAPLILDACCGTGGFLIEAMAKLTRQLKDGPLAQTLSVREKRKIEGIIKDQRLIGIDAGKDPPVARIARINMYLHGDGGSRIYSADALDKKVRVPSTASPEHKRELHQLKENLTGDDAIKVDVVLTNPPFSMKKEAKDADQRDILQDYDSAFTVKGGVKKPRSSLKSNVMFLERYRDLLKPGTGRMLTVIDESVLNTITAAEHRAMLFRNFYIRAIISLPQDTFAEAGANVKTSILMLERKEEPSDEQPSTFYGRSDNIGYQGSRINETLSDLPTVLAAFRRFQDTGNVPDEEKAHWTDRTRFFVKKLTTPSERIDVEWHDPRHAEMERRLKVMKKQKGYLALSLGGPDGLCNFIRGKVGEYVSEGVPIIKVRNVTGEGIDWNTDFVLSSFYDSAPNSHLNRGDVLVTTTGLGTIGRVDLFDSDEKCVTDGHVTSLRLRVPQAMDPDFLVHYLRSPLGQMQFDRYTVGCTGQTELNDSDLAKFVVTFPKSLDAQSVVLAEAKRYDDAAIRAREESRRNRLLARTEFERLLGL